MPTMKGEGMLGLLRSAALMATGAGTVGAIALMLSVPRHRIPFLMVLMSVWVGAPFVILAWALIKSGGWAVSVRVTLCVVTLLVTAGTLVIYGHFVANPRPSQPAAPFVLTPVVSVIFTAIAIGLARLISRRPT